MSNLNSKVFCIGFMKTGTTTQNRALTMLGYRVSNRSWKLLRPILYGDWETVKSHVNGFDAFEDNPVPLIYKELDAMFPGSKFILTVRDPESWYKSVSHHIGSLRTPMHEWVFGRGKGLPKDDKDHTIRIYNEHIAAVKAYFAHRPDDLLIHELETDMSWEKICTFLVQPIPKEPFPHSNKSNYNESKPVKTGISFTSIRKRIKNRIVLIYLNLRGVLPER